MIPTPTSDRFNHTRDRANDAFERRHLDGQLFAACCSQLVVTSAAVASRRAPLRGHPSLDEHPLQRGRSEEHTSELQSRLHLVCRLLLEKKKKPTDTKNFLKITKPNFHRLFTLEQCYHST